MAVGTQRRSACAMAIWLLAGLLCLNAGLAAADCLGGRLAVAPHQGVVRARVDALSLNWSPQLEKELQAYADEVALAGKCSAPLSRNFAEAVFLSRDRTSSSCASDAATWIGQITDLKSARGQLAIKAKASDVACGHALIPGTTCAITVCSWASDAAAADDIGVQSGRARALLQEETSEETSQETSEETSVETSEETSEETSIETSEETSEETSQETSEEVSAQDESHLGDAPAASSDLMHPAVDAEGIITQVGHPGNGQYFDEWVYEQDPNYRRRLQQQRRTVFRFGAPRKMRF